MTRGRGSATGPARYHARRRADERHGPSDPVVPDGLSAAPAILRRVLPPEGPLLVDIAFLVIGLALLAWASEQFVVGASRIATAMRLSAVLVGALVIGFGTSLPEFLVTIVAAADGAADIALGNVVGSNIANLTLVLGLAAVIAPIAVAAGVVRREALLSLGAVVALAIALQAGVGRIEGVVLIVLLIAVLGYLIATSAEAPSASSVPDRDDTARRGLPFEAGRTVIGLAGTLAGAQLLVSGAQGVADSAGLSEGFVGLTIVAVGTSLPELFAAIQAGRRGASDLIVGNVLGSNIFNSLGIAGLAMVIDPGAVAANVAQTGAIAMAVLAVLVFAMMVRGRIGRVEGTALLISFAVLVPLLQ